MSIRKYLNKNKIGALILIIVIIIAFGFGGFGGGFLSNNQNNLAKIDKTNITKNELINYISRSGISEKALQENLNNNIIEDLLTNLISTTLLTLEIKNFDFKISENSLSKKIKLNNNFADENGIFQRIKYEKFLLENNTSAPLFEKQLKDRELQKQLFDFIGAGTVSPEFLVNKLFENENKKLEINYINLENFYKNENEINDQDLLIFLKENNNQLKSEYIDFKYTLLNPMNLIGINEFNKDFFEKVDEIENNIINGVNFNSIVSEFDLNVKKIKNFKFSDESNQYEKKIYQAREKKYDIIESSENFIIYEIENIQKKDPDIKDPKTRNEILKLLIQKNKFEYNKKLLKQIRDKELSSNYLEEMNKNLIQSLTLNSIRDNKKFEINSVKMLYSLPVNSFALISDESNNIYLAKIINYKNINLNKSSDDYQSFIKKENTKIRNSILKSYDYVLNKKYDVTVNQLAINNIKNLFQ
tara:strand:+ start:545 stop:1963 length:1419 start_codon:yes stop_codon:yes gene_type:complete